MNTTILSTALALTLIMSAYVTAEETHPTLEQHKQASHEAHWDYEKHGPEHWGNFSGTCDMGKAQSPINIVPTQSIELDALHEISFAEDFHTDAKIFDNGHSIKVIPSNGSKITIHGKDYKLVQFHFHGKSEHTIDGRQYDMVAHMVYQAKDKTLAVVAVMFEVGEKNEFLQTIINNIGSTANIDPQDLLPKDISHYYHYIGSLTTPPCSENVQWYILKHTDSISNAQLKTFRKFYIDNQRPVQAINARDIESK